MIRFLPPTGRQAGERPAATDPGPGMVDRERRLIDAVVSLAKVLRDERERLAARLAEVDEELRTLAVKFEPSIGDEPGSDAVDVAGGLRAQPRLVPR